MDGLLGTNYPTMRSRPYMSDLSPEEQAQRREEMAMGGLLALEGGAMMMPSSGVAEMLGYLPDPMGEGYLPSTADLIAEGDIEGLGYQLLGAAGDVMYAAAPLTGGLLAVPAASAKATRAAKLTKDQKDPMGYSKVALDKPIEETDIRIIPTDNLKPAFDADLNMLASGNILGFVGDKTAATGLLSGIDELDFAYPVKREGGQDFMRAEASQSPDAAIWASASPRIGLLLNRARMLEETTGNPVYGVYYSMSPQGVDYATMTADALLSQIPASKIAKKDMKAFDDEIKEIDPNWVGTESPAARDYLINNPETRMAFVKRMDTSPHQTAGFPNVGKTRYALTQEDLRDTQGYMAGMNVAKIDTSRDYITNPLVPHTTYDTMLSGEYVGRLPSLLAQDVFPEKYSQYTGEMIRKRPQSIMKSFERSAPPSVFTDEVLRAFEKAREK